MKSYTKHVFVCENIREGGAPVKSCGREGGAELRQALKKMVHENGLKKTIRINSAGCLGACDHGPVMVIYPQGLYYGGFRESDLNEIFQKSILNDQAIEYLLIDD